MNTGSIDAAVLVSKHAPVLVLVHAGYDNAARVLLDHAGVTGKLAEEAIRKARLLMSVDLSEVAAASEPESDSTHALTAAPGWFLPRRARKAHFSLMGRSLCGYHRSGSAKLSASPPAEHLCCRTCFQRAPGVLGSATETEGSPSS